MWANSHLCWPPSKCILTVQNWNENLAKIHALEYMTALEIVHSFVPGTVVRRQVETDHFSIKLLVASKIYRKTHMIEMLIKNSIMSLKMLEQQKKGNGKRGILYSAKCHSPHQ